MLTAMVQEAAERGAANVTVAHVVARSGVSRRTFYEEFADREDCFLAAFDETVDRVAEAVLAAYAQRGSWADRTRAALTAFLELLDAEPSAGRVVVVESLAAGPMPVERRRQLIGRLVVAFDRAREGTNTNVAQPSPLTAEGAIGGVLAVLYERLLEAEPPAMVGLVGPLMSMLVLPYLGPAAARQELKRPKPPAKRKAPRQTAESEPLRGLELRLTYRTVRVLTAAAAKPGSSNRAIGEDAGMSDQGQISKLLARLQRLGLVENITTEPQRGEPNSWALTERGWRVHAAIRAEKDAA